MGKLGARDLSGLRLIVLLASKAKLVAGDGSSIVIEHDGDSVRILKIDNAGISVDEIGISTFVVSD